MIRVVSQSFAGGEIAPELHMRGDLAAYQKGAAKLHNMIVRRTGSVMKRAGTDALAVGVGFYGVGQFSHVKLLPFFYDEKLSLVLLVNNALIRVYEVSPELKWDRDVDWAASQWADADVAAMRARQVGDTLFVTAPGKLPLRWVRDAASGAWSVNTETVEGAPTYSVSVASVTLSREGWDGYDPNKSKTLYYGIWAENAAGQRKRLFYGKTIGVSKAWEAGASIKAEIAKSNIPEAAVGDIWILGKKYGGGYGIVATRDITSEDRTGGGNVELFRDDNVVPNETIGTQQSIRSDDDSGGYGLVDFYQQRQVLAGNTNAPWSLWFSRLADLYTWRTNRPADDMDPFRATIPAARASAIRHLVSGKRLLVLTEDGVYAVHSEGEGFSGRSCRIEKVNPLGAGLAEPLDTGGAVLFMASDNRTLLEMRYSFAEDAHVAVDRSVLARHLTGSAGVGQMAWQTWPDGLIWTVLDDGRLLSFTYLPEHEVYAWAQHEVMIAALDAKGEVALQRAQVRQIAATGALLRDTRTSGARSEMTTVICMLAEYEGASGTERVILRLRQAGGADAWCLDARGSVTGGEGGTEASVPAGNIWRVDGGPWQPAPAAAHGVSLAKGAQLEWGVAVAAELETLRPEAPERQVQGLRRRVVQCTIRSLASGAYEVAEAIAGGVVVPSGGNKHEPGAAHDDKLPALGGWDWDGRMRISSHGPDPLEVLGVTLDIEFETGR